MLKFIARIPTLNMRIMIAESCKHNWALQIGKFMLNYDVGQKYVGLKAEVVNFE